MELVRLSKTGLLLSLFLILVSPARCPALASQAMIEPHAQAMPLLPFLDYIIDQSMGMDIEEASRATGWQPLIPDRLPRQEGIMWLRFTIAPLAPDARAQTFLLDMGQSVPGQPVLYDPFRNELSGALEWRENMPGPRNILLLPEAANEAIPCYIRLDGLPGPWFSPMIRTPQNAASNWGSLAQTGAILALAVVMFICLLRGASEKGQWRYWTALFVAVALLQALLGMPALNGSFNLAEIAAVLSPGIALMLMPHAGRHLMLTKKHSRSIDIQLFLLGLPGAALAILPLVPGWSWLYRWLDLWPAATVVFVPTALWAWLLAIPGARRFLLACLIPPACVACGLLGLDFGLPANVLASGPTWGVALAALLLAATRSPAHAQDQAIPNKEAAPSAQAPRAPLPELEMEPEEEEVINLEHPLDDPNLRLILPKRQEPMEEAVPEPEPEPHEPAPFQQANLESRENALRAPLDTILREGAALGKCSLPASARQYAENMISASHELAEILSRPAGLHAETGKSQKDESFNLQRILRNAHNSVAASAEYSGIALSWYMPPHLAQIYRGDALALESTLSMLLESSVRSAHRGAIKISVRRVPDSSDPGHLLFTVTDDGEGYPPLDRSSLALVKAWELTGEYGGYLSVECSQHGATIAFTAHFQPVEEEAALPESKAGPHVILISEDSEMRRHLGRIIEPLSCVVSEIENEPGAIACQTQHPAGLIICEGRFARPAAADMIRQMIRIARQAGIKCQALALTSDENEWGLLKASGFTHAMLEPVDPEILRRTVSELAGNGDEETEARDQRSHTQKTDSKAPSMLIEQSFPVATVFEGPDWLGSQEEEAGENPGSPESRDVQAPASAAEWVGEPTPVGRPASGPLRPDNEPGSAPAGSAGEWVGEPVPVSRPAQPSKPETQPPVKAPIMADEWVGEPTPIVNTGQAAGNPAVASSAPESASEWVGEPMPVRKAAQQTPQAKQAPANAPAAADEWVGEPVPVTGSRRQLADRDKPSGMQPVEGALLDFVVGVNDKKPDSQVRGFVESSVNMVTSTLSSMLRQKESAPIEEEPIKARSDPAIIALLERMDAAMRHANAAYAASNAPAIAESTGMIAADAEKFGLRLLARMAKCVERAAAANDLAALSDLLPELGLAVERNRITLAQRKQG